MKFLGANWRTTASAIGAGIFSLLTVLAALPLELGEIATIIPPEWKAKVVVASAAATLILRIINGAVQKDRNVTGGTTQQTVSGAVAEPGTQALVDETVIASINSGEPVTSEQRNAVRLTQRNPL